MDERDWSIISALYKYKNITKVADIFYISQPAVTTRIKNIEENLGYKLIHRSNKGITFTAHGEYAAQFANKILAEVNDFKNNLADVGKGVVGTLKIASPSIIGRYYLPAFLEKFQSYYPKVKFEIYIKSSTEILKLVNSGLIDFGFTKHCDNYVEEEKHLLLTYPVLVVNKEPFELADLPNMKLVSYPYETYYYEVLQRWWRDHFEQQPQIGSRVTNLDLCKEMVFSGLGYGFLPDILVPECPYPLVTKKMYNKDKTPFTRNTWLVFKKQTLDNKISDLFYEYAKKSNFSEFLRSRNQINANTIYK
ncbi:LysR family transcriptional regulator [uncultured Megasphaera sp.]|mgnify:FL=1|jgi:DNA-binding transcriptional LysR family regulator|uniref:LysR family transcriptional regulator n=1 Tax=uncultured Megasphaera sp. TaxID=165188 RepID=UPI002586D9E2|nr:LysR family transcriptional regulator [uncultured Megasphaera sp.]